MSIKRTTAPQDDKREQEQLRIFGLRQDPDSSREDNDAILDLSGFESQRIELKTTTKTSLTTARDFGVSHIQNWRGKHILASFYDGSGREIRWSLLIPSHFLNRWLDSQRDYVELDLRIIESVESSISEEFLNQLRNSVFPGQERYTLNELKKLLKNQISKEDLLAFLDNAQAYASPESMNRAVKERLRYFLLK